MPPWRTMCRTEDLRAADLWLEKEHRYAEVSLVIVDVRAGEVLADGKRTERPFVYFARHPWVPSKPLKLNSTNGMTIESLTGTAIAEDWRGTAITLVVTKTKAPRGGMVDTIRVAQKLPEQPKRESKPPNAPTPDEQRAIAERERAEAGHGR